MIQNRSPCFLIICRIVGKDARLKSIRPKSISDRVNSREVSTGRRSTPLLGTLDCRDRPDALHVKFECYREDLENDNSR